MNLEDLLHDLADDVSAPPTDEARDAVSRRTGVLRRRRQTRRAVGGGLLAVLAIAGAVALATLRDGADVDVGPVEQPDESGTPAAWRFEREGWEETSVDQGLDEGQSSEGTSQVFREQGSRLGRTIVLWHSASSDVADLPGGERVAVGAVQGDLHPLGDDGFTLTWNPANSDSTATLESYGLDRQDVLDVAAGLRPLDDDIAFPPSPDDRFGFEVSYLPEGMMEVVWPSGGQVPSERVVIAADGRGGTVSVGVQRDGPGLDTQVAELLVLARAATRIEVGGHTAYLFEEAGVPWTIVWRQGDAVVTVSADVADGLTADELVDGLRQVSEAEWALLVVEQATISTAPTSTVEAQTSESRSPGPAD